MRIERTQLAQHTQELIRDSSFLFLVSYKGLTVLQFGEFRDKLAVVNAKCQVLKNTFIRNALKTNGISTPDSFVLTGETAVVFGKGDATASAKVIEEFTKQLENVRFKFGLVGGQLVSASDAAAIAKLPSREHLLAQTMGLLQAPARTFVSLLNAKVASVVYLFQSYVDKKKQSA